MARTESLVWVVVAPMPAEALAKVVRRITDAEPPEIVGGTGGRSAVIETELSARGWDAELATALSKVCDGPVYALGFAGWDDPDDGIPYVTRYDAGREQSLWEMPDPDDEDAATLPAVVDGMPFSDLFELAAALGIDLSRWR